MSIPVPHRSIRFISRVSLAPVIVGLLAVSLMGAVVPVGTPESVGLSAERLQRINQVPSTPARAPAPSRSCRAEATSRTSRPRA